MISEAIYRQLLSVVTLLALCGHAAGQVQSAKQLAPTNTVLPLEAELITPLTQDKLKVGAPFVTRVIYKWTTPQCTVKAGSLITGEVVSNSVDSDHKIAIATLRINPVGCTTSGGATVPLRMHALMVPPSPLSERDFANRGGLYTGYASIIPDGTTNYASMLSGSPGSLHMDWEQSSAFANDKLSKTVTRGSVIGTKNLSLELDGPANSFAVRQKGKKFELLTGTVFILLPNDSEDFLKKMRDVIAKSDMKPPSASAATPANFVGPNEAARRASLALEEAEVCSKECSVAPASTTLSKGKASVWETMNLERYGYLRIAHHAVDHFATTDSVIYLDDSNLLVTFDRHTMRRRLHGEIRSEYERPVRALLIDPHTRQVKKVVDWRVLGDTQYVWPAGHDRVLLRLGRKLYLVGSNLQPIKSFDIPEPFVWLASDPSGSRFAVGLLHELHNTKLHEVLARAAGIEPEESVEVTFLDANLEPLGTSSQPSSISPPVLADAAEIRAVPQRDQQWHLQQISQDLKHRRVATVLSDCPVRVSTPASNIVFAVGCRHDQNWYRAFRLDGHLILRGTSSSQDIEQAAVGDTAQRAIAVRVVETFGPEGYNAEIKQSDVNRESVSVYRAEDGKLLFTQNVADVPFTQQSFALSPNAAQLALLGTSSLRLVSVPFAAH